MARKKAEKADVLEKLDTSIRYCNSHRDDVQTLFDGIVETYVNVLSRPDDYEIRQLEMKSLFPVLLDPATRGFIPSIGMREEELDLDAREFLERWFIRWVAKFVGAWDTLPSDRVARPKGAVTDYALIKMVASHAESEEEAKRWVQYHNLFMSAENIGGSLLEEYIASKVEQYNWIWCRGQVLTAVDFCNRDCTEFIQIKNKSNTENSSGKGFRIDRRAPSWFRMHAARKDGRIVTRWPDLMDVIKRGAGPLASSVPDDLLSEEDYLSFIESVSRKNPELITSEEK